MMIIYWYINTTAPVNCHKLPPGGIYGHTQKAQQQITLSCYSHSVTVLLEM